MGLVLTNVVEHNLVTPYSSVPVSTVRALGDGPTGAVLKNFGAVIEVR